MRIPAAALFALLIAIPSALAQQAPPVLQGAFSLAIDHAALFTLPADTQALIVGNPSIADVTKPGKSGNLAVITGKAFGQTNVLLTDSEGRLLAAASIRVEQVAGPMVTVQRGADSRQTYSCTPACAPALALGDSASAFQTTGVQMQTRENLAAPPLPGFPALPRTGAGAGAGMGAP